MKKSFTYRSLIVAAFTLCIIISFSCRKYNYTNRIEKTWVVNSYLKNGADSTANFNTMKANYVIIFDNNNGFTETYLDAGSVSVSNQGRWD